MKPIQVSAIVPVFNQETRISACLESLLAQEDVDLEIICIDDGSADRTPELLKEFQQRDQRVVVIEQGNHGAGHSRNVGMAQARGEYVIFCDADDVIANPRAYARLYRAAKASDALIAAGSFSVREDDGDAVETEFSGLLRGYSFSEEGLVPYEEYQFDYGFTRFMFDRELLLREKIEFPEYKRYEDPVFLVKALVAAGSFYAIPDIVYECNVGHQKVVWDKGTSLDLLAGVGEILEISAEHGLWNLHSLALERMDVEYCGIFQLPVCDHEVLGALIKANSRIVWSEVEKAQRERDQYSEGVYLMRPLRIVFEDYQWRSAISKTKAFTVARFASAIPRKLSRFFGRSVREPSREEQCR